MNNEVLPSTVQVCKLSGSLFIASFWYLFMVWMMFIIVSIYTNWCVYLHIYILKGNTEMLEMRAQLSHWTQWQENVSRLAWTNIPISLTVCRRALNAAFRLLGTLNSIINYSFSGHLPLDFPMSRLSDSFIRRRFPFPRTTQVHAVLHRGLRLHAATQHAV